MTTPADIKWGSYKSWEGPWFRGTQRLTMVANPSPAFKRVYVSSSSEGGFDSINMYDKCTMSIGMSQACETPWRLTSKLVAAIAERDPGLLEPLRPALEASNADFVKTRGKWRFVFTKPFKGFPAGEVDPGAEQKALFLLDSNGHKGTWGPKDSPSRSHGKLWAASMANMLVQPAAKEAQIEWVSSRAALYAMPNAKKVLFDGAADDGWVGAFRAAYLSYALNIPTRADQMLTEGLRTVPGKKWSPEWCIYLLKYITFKSGVGIWPHRYSAIEDSVQRLYGVDIPDSHEELKAWKVEQGLADVDDEVIYEEEPEAKGLEPTFTTTKEVQAHLIAMGYDLGPSGADGRLGRKSRDAVRTFQRLNGLTPDGLVGKNTRAKLLETWRAKVCA